VKPKQLKPSSLTGARAARQSRAVKSCGHSGSQDLAFEEIDLLLRVARRQPELVSALAEEEAERLAVSYERIRIGGQRALWGSCSARGTLSFNRRLVLAPLEVLDYLVVHELCHLRVPNHSKRFWKLVEGRRPLWREQRDWLREHGPELLAFSPSD
jgi:predicted metal-dependent hydrolase